MLTDEKLREAAAEVDRFLLSAVPEEDEEPHVFSWRFERKMKKIANRAEKPAGHQILRTAVAAAMVTVSLCAALLTVSPQVRAAVADWIEPPSNVFTDRYAIYYNGKDGHVLSEDAADYEYRLTGIPDGFYEFKVIDFAGEKTCFYTNGEVNMWFSYRVSEHGKAYLDVQGYIQDTAIVNGVPADVYICGDNTDGSVIVWWDSDTGALLHICALADKEELVQLAETVEKSKKN